MERKLVLIRHAKSDWSNSGQTDFDRTLNERGKKDAPVMGNRLLERNIIPDLILSSPAKRAAKTAKLMAKELNYDTDKIQWIDKLYHCPGELYEDVLLHADIHDEVKTVFIFSHNPGITHFANDILPQFTTDNIPTCGIVALSFHAEHWSDFPNAKHDFIFYDFPKNK